MKIFCSYALTGEDQSLVQSRMKKVCDTLTHQGFEPFCDILDETGKHLTQPSAIFAHVFHKLERTDVTLAIVTSPRRSEGQLIEIGAALVLKKPVVLLQHTSAVESSYLPSLVTKTFTWTSEDDLMQLLKSPQLLKQS